MVKKVAPKSGSGKLDVIANDISYLKDDVREIKTQITSNYVTKDQFEPVRRLVYGTVGIILTAVIVAVVALVIGNS